VIKVDRLHAMRVRSNDEVNAAIDQPTREVSLFVSDLIAVFNPPVNKANQAILRTE
jgi:hypothetical protein